MDHRTAGHAGARPRRPVPDRAAAAPRRGAYAALVDGLRARFPGDIGLHRDLLAAATLDEVLAALARSAAAAAAVARRDPRADPAGAARAEALRDTLAFFRRTRGGAPAAEVRLTRAGTLRVRADGSEHVWVRGAAGWAARPGPPQAGSRPS
jgi:hypothetical protein